MSLGGSGSRRKPRWIVAPTLRLQRGGDWAASSLAASAAAGKVTRLAKVSGRSVAALVAAGTTASEWA